MKEKVCILYNISNFYRKSLKVISWKLNSGMNVRDILVVLRGTFFPLYRGFHISNKISCLLTGQLDNSGCKLKTTGGVKTRAIVQGFSHIQIDNVKEAFHQMEVANMQEAFHQMQIANMEEAFHQMHLPLYTKVLVLDGVRVEEEKLIQ